MNANIVNIDYEYQLFDDNYAKEKYYRLIHEYEYVYFLSNQSNDPLASKNKYSSEYLNYLSDLSFYIPEIKIESKNYTDWWGSLNDKDLASKLNSKLTSSKFAFKNNLSHKYSKHVQNIIELKEYLDTKKGNWILKSPFEMAGKGHLAINLEDVNWKEHTQKWITKKSCNEYILEPSLDRIVDIGCTFHENENPDFDNLKLHIQDNVGLGIFKGGWIFDRYDKLESFVDIMINSNSHLLLDSLKENYLKIYFYYKGMGANSNFGIDSFIFRENEKISTYELVEVNCRRTMGAILQQLKFLLPSDGMGRWLFIKNKYGQKLTLKEVKSLMNQFKYDRKTKCGVVLTSPTNLSHLSFFITGTEFQIISAIELGLRREFD